MNILITKVDYVAYKDPSDPLNKIIIRAAVYGGSSFDGPIRNISVTGNVAIDKFFEEGNLVSCQSKRVRGIKLYEVSNYLGNVHAVITDRKIPIKKTDGTESVSFYQSELVQFSDYYPFGQTVKSRTSTSQIYNFAYNGMLKDDEIQGVGNSYTTFFREYNPRLGRWTAIDPKFSKLPHQSSYCSMDNNPIVYNDPLGDIVRYEKFRDRVNVFFARMGSKEFRSEHKARVNSQDTYTYKKRPDSPYLKDPLIINDITLPNGRIDGGSMKRLDNVSYKSVYYDIYGIGGGGFGDDCPDCPPIRINFPDINITTTRDTKTVTVKGELSVPQQSDGSNPSQGPYVIKSPKRWVSGTPVELTAVSHPDNFTLKDQNGNDLMPPTTIVMGNIPLVNVKETTWLTVPTSQSVTSWTASVTSQRYYKPENPDDKFMPPTDNYDVFYVRYKVYKVFPSSIKISIKW